MQPIVESKNSHFESQYEFRRDASRVHVVNTVVNLAIGALNSRLDWMAHSTSETEIGAFVDIGVPGYLGSLIQNDIE